jgi:hypothetical protein
MIVDSQTSFMDIARLARVSRHVVTKHSKHLVETYNEPVRPSVIYAPTINMVVPEPNSREPGEEEQDPAKRCMDIG